MTITEKLKVAREALLDIAEGLGACQSPGCSCCTAVEDDDFSGASCDVGTAIDGLREIGIEPSIRRLARA